MEFYIYVKERFGDEKVHSDIETILNTYYKFNAIKGKTKDEILKVVKKQIKKETLLEINKQENEKMGIDSKTRVIEAELVYATKGKFVEGTYYAHEYNRYAKGKARKVTYSNGFVQYEVKCLNNNLIVLDGFWDDVKGNGCGDQFEPFKEVV